MRQSRVIASLVVAAGLVIGCASAPSSFSKTVEPGWSTIEVRDDMEYEDAWQEVVDVLAKKFELEMIAKDGGYARTSWIYTWWKAGEITENYRVRAVIKFDPDKDALSVKTEANYLDGGEWVPGTDTRLLQTVKTDIMGVVGRTTR